MFSGCSSLSSLPNLEKWNVRKDQITIGMFEGCKKKLKKPSWA